MPMTERPFLVEQTRPSDNWHVARCCPAARRQAGDGFRHNLPFTRWSGNVLDWVHRRPAASGWVDPEADAREPFSCFQDLPLVQVRGARRRTMLN